jgi:hypothetical protein
MARSWNGSIESDYTGREEEAGALSIRYFPMTAKNTSGRSQTALVVESYLPQVSHKMCHTPSSVSGVHQHQKYVSSATTHITTKSDWVPGD